MKKIFGVLPLFFMLVLSSAAAYAGHTSFDTVDDLIAAGSDLKVEDTVNTRGFYDAGDGGAAVYTIVGEDEPEVQGEVIPLEDGKKAKLNITDQTIDVKQFGALGDGITDESGLLQHVFDYLLTDRVEKVTLSEGTYVVDNQMIFNSGIYEGKEGAKIKITLLRDDWCFRNKHALYTGSNGQTDTIILDNIDFSYMSYVPEKVNLNMKMIRFDNTADSKITNCNFYTEEGNYNGVCALDMYTNNNNLTIDRCNFELYSINPNTDAKNRPLITPIMLREYQADQTSENVTIKNCTIKKNGWDETLWVDPWHGTLENIVVDNCHLIDEGNATTTLRVGASTPPAGAKNVMVKNSVIDKYNYSYVVVQTKDKGDQISENGKNIVFENNIVNIKSASELLPGASIFTNAYSLANHTNSQNILYDKTAVTSSAPLNIIFKDGSDSTLCKNTHLNLSGASCVFAGVKEIDGVTCENEIDSHLIRGAATIKNVKVKLKEGKNFVQDESSQRACLDISSCEVACTNFINANIGDANPNYYKINISDCTIRNSLRLIHLWLNAGQAYRTDKIDVTVTDSTLDSSKIYSRFSDKVNCVFMNSNRNGSPLSQIR